MKTKLNLVSKQEKLCPQLGRQKGTIIVAAALAMAASHAQATESHGGGFENVSASYSISDVNFGTSYTTAGLSIERFDTMGGTRVLQEIYFEIQVQTNYSWMVGDNLTSNTAGLEWEYDGLWTATSGGESVFEIEESPDIFTSGGGGVIQYAFWDGYTLDGAHLAIYEGLYTDPSNLAAFTGTSPLVFDAQLDIDDVRIGAVDPLDHPPGTLPDDLVYDPNLPFEVDLSNFEFEIRLTYQYANVPSPAGLSILGMGALFAGRRRRG